jgi:hypothetical protein
LGIGACLYGRNSGEYMTTSKKKLSPSRTYMAMLNNADFSGYYFIRFTIPACYEDVEPDWYFLHQTSIAGCLEVCFAIEDIQPFLKET